MTAAGAPRMCWLAGHSRTTLSRQTIVPTASNAKAAMLAPQAAFKASGGVGACDVTDRRSFFAVSSSVAWPDTAASASAAGSA